MGLQGQEIGGWDRAQYLGASGELDEQDHGPSIRRLVIDGHSSCCM